MTISEIINKVKWCIDHETHEDAKLADNGEDSYMDNIIRAKINDARRWLAVATSQSVTLSSPGSSSSTSVTTLTITPYDGFSDIATITIPLSLSTVTLSRVRLSSWHKAAIPILDTSDDAMLMFDDTAKGTLNRPLATVMQGSPTRILVQPYTSTDTAEIVYIGIASDIDTSSDDSTVDIPTIHESAFIYYIAYLLLTAYQDPRAQAMFAIAVQLTGSKQSV
ncbi:phage adaptor protein [Prevotella sp.]|uniref:phage adaptor protein n=1 Tax=Prevotella sp. TaxID=59823 RepID=UPI0027E32B41|nr:hypothetical protein [Prevotella sp.]